VGVQAADPTGGPLRLGSGTSDGSPDRQDGYAPLDKWQSHTQRFIKRYGLDEGQKTAAMSILKETRSRAKAYERSHKKELGRLRKAVRKAKGQVKSRRLAELAEVDAPLQEIYEELQTRLDNLLTVSQRELTAQVR
jgi:hypothetical protein